MVQRILKEIFSLAKTLLNGKLTNQTRNQTAQYSSNRNIRVIKKIRPKREGSAKSQRLVLKNREKNRLRVSIK